MNVVNIVKGIFLDKRLIQKKNEELVDKNISGKSFQVKYEDKNNRKQILDIIIKKNCVWFIIIVLVMIQNDRI